MRQNRTNIAPWALFAAACIGAFVAPFLFPFAEAQRVGYVERATNGAFANHLAPNPVAGKVLAAQGTSNRAEWVDPAASLPTGTAGQVLGIVAATATRTVVVTGSQTSTATETYSFTQSQTSTTTGTVTGATGTYTYTATSTSTGIASSGEISTGTNPRDVCIMGDYAYVANGGAGTVSVFDISNPAAPSASGLPTVTVGSDPRGVACADGWVYVANYGSDSISVIDAATPASAHVESTFSVTAGCQPRALAVRGSRLYMVCFSSGTSGAFWTINSSNKASLSQVGSALTIPNGPIDVSIEDDYYARITCQNGGEVVTVEYDSVNGGGTNVGHADNTDGPYGIYQRYPFIAVAGSTNSTLSIYDTSLSPSLIGSVSTGSSSGPRHLVLYGSTVILAAFGANKVQVYSFASSGNPSFVEDITAAGGPLDIKLNGDWVWVTRYTDAKLQSFYVGKYKQFNGTQTTTNSQTGTVTQNTTSTATGTQTVATTGIVTSSTTGIGTGTDTSWQAIYAPASSVIGNYYLYALNCEGTCYDASKLEDITNGVSNIGLIQNATVTAACSSGSDGLIADFLHVGTDPWPVWAGGMWAAHIKASSTGASALRIEVWDNVDGQLFSMTTGPFNSPGPSDIYAATLQPARRPSVSTNTVHFKLYAVCSSPATVTFYSDSTFSSWIESPLHSDKQSSANVSHNGSTVYSELVSLASKPRTLRSAFVPWSAFYNGSSLTVGTLGSSSNGTITQHAVMPDGTSISRLHGYLWKRPSEYTGGAITVRPLWVPLTTDTNYNHKVSWEAYYVPLMSGGEYNIVDIASSGGTAVQWDGDTSFAHYGTDGFTATAIMLESGHSFTPSVFEWLRIAIGRNHASGTDTYVGDVGFVGLQIDYPSYL